jgi:hypothetical protein
MKSFFFLGALLCVCLASRVVGDESQFVDVNIRPEYREAILGNEYLMHGAVDVADIPTDGQVLVGVGLVAIKNPENPSPKEVLDARKVASAKAAREVSRYLESRVSTETTITKKTVVDVEQTAEEEVKRARRITKLVDSWTREQSQMVRRVKEVGSWYSADHRYLHVAVAVMPDK